MKTLELRSEQVLKIYANNIYKHRHLCHIADV